ncbi:MAG: hypothetical protein KDC34_18075 [Saprospiraceae bacterium]|nr:hypothetical protein [Saprospiraceae bacterium]
MIFDQKTTDIIFQDFEIDKAQEALSEEQVFELLSNQIAYMIEYRLEFLLSLLYRMDVLEAKIDFALSPLCEDPANIALAKLVMDRQKVRMATKKNVEVNEIEGLEDGLKW